jgi:hypothetical protein
LDLNDFGQYTDAIQGATVTFLKFAPAQVFSNSMRLAGNEEN